MAEINVVPYIDVMLVLLVIFMVTAPLITQGVKVDLPQAEAQPQPGEGSPPVVIHIDQFGDTYVDLGDNDLLPVDQQLLYERLRDLLDAARRPRSWCAPMPRSTTAWWSMRWSRRRPPARRASGW
jgi:biopolymer transport protein ExbD